MLNFLFILLLFSLGFMLSSGLFCCAIDMIFGTSIAHVVMGFGALISGAILGLMLMIVVITLIIDWVERFISEHKNK